MLNALLRVTLQYSMKSQAQVTVSIVSHGQAVLIGHLLSDLQRHCTTPLKVILTLNIEEATIINVEEFDFPIEIIRNTIPKGFSANHNAAFKYVETEYFCVLNPDIRIEQDPYPSLIEHANTAKTGVVGPLIINSAGEVEDCARLFPTPFSILRKLLSRSRKLEFELHAKLVFPDWLAGMFMLFHSDIFRWIGGFDEGYFLYYEDVDLCWRLRRAGYSAVLVPSVCAIHDAQRDSHHRIRYWFWHVRSMMRFFSKKYLNCR